MVALVIVLKVGVETLAELTSLARVKAIAVPMVKLQMPTEMMVASASANLDGKVTAAMLP